MRYPGRYIMLQPEKTPNTEIRDFTAELRACTDDVLSGDDSDLYSEDKFQHDGIGRPLLRVEVDATGSDTRAPGTDHVREGRVPGLS